MWFNFNILTLIIHLLPISLAKQNTFVFLKVLTKPVNDLYLNLVAYRQQLLYYVSFTGQVIYLEKLLNDRFTDPVNPDIYISDEAYIETAYQYNSAEGLIGSYDYTIAEAQNNYFYTLAEGNRNNFIINIPAATYATLTANSNKLLNQLKALVEKYKNTGAIYKIEVI